MAETKPVFVVEIAPLWGTSRRTGTWAHHCETFDHAMAVSIAQQQSARVGYARRKYAARVVRTVREVLEVFGEEGR